MSENNNQNDNKVNNKLYNELKISKNDYTLFLIYLILTESYYVRI